MARFSIQADGEVYFIDAELETRVRALEEAVLALQDKAGVGASEQIAANLQASLNFEQAQAEAKAVALSAEALDAEALDAVSLALEEAHLAAEEAPPIEDMDAEDAAFPIEEAEAADDVSSDDS